MSLVLKRKVVVGFEGKRHGRTNPTDRTQKEMDSCIFFAIRIGALTNRWVFFFAVLFAVVSSGYDVGILCRLVGQRKEKKNKKEKAGEAFRELLNEAEIDTTIDTYVSFKAKHSGDTRFRRAICLAGQSAWYLGLHCPAARRYLLAGPIVDDSHD